MLNKIFNYVSFFIPPVLVFVLNFALYTLGNVYVLFSWYDIPLHFLGGVSLAITGMLFLNSFEEEYIMYVKNNFLRIVILLSFISLIAILWEFWEYFMKVLFYVPWQTDIADTLGDFAMALLGGLSGIFIYKKFKLI